jgi:hypothetical protein
MSSPEPSEFEKAGQNAGKESLFGEFVDFLAENRNWWLLPILIVLALLGLLIVLSNSAVAPFIYTLF